MTDAASRDLGPLEVARSRALEQVAARAPLSEILSELVLTLEARSDAPMRGSVLLLDADGKRLTHGAAPHLSQTYCEAIDGVEIGPAVGSCGTAAHYGEAVFVTDIKADPLWVDFADLALADGLRACWSVPIKDHAGKVLGTFANYYLQARNPRPQEIRAMTFAASVVADAILSHRRVAGAPV
jgi:GAF domain-containing protein